ncbi:MAG: endonuclease/exonuclease/phosphatase family protein [Anaerolineae bacterium]|nr:endonuclease/exonuclease/phosphatase family protein [Anaerolineae bacterium]
MAENFPGRFARALYNGLIALIGAYGLSVFGFLILRAMVGESLVVIATFNSFAHLLYLPALILLPLCLLLGRVRVALLLVPAVAAFLLTYGQSFLPRTVPAPDQTFSILTYNLKSQTVNLEKLTAVIEAADADIVALQELSEAAADHLATVFAEAYPHQALHPQPGEPIPGQGVLSRYPITADEYWRIYLGHQRITLTLEDQPVALYNSHPIHPFVSRYGFEWRAEEISTLLQRADAETMPVLIAGDFNMSDQSEDYAHITTRYQDSYRQVGWGLGFTFPNLFDENASLVQQFGFAGGVPPLARLDYVFHDDYFQSVEAQVWPDAGGSDHRPVYVVLGRKD